MSPSVTIFPLFVTGLRFWVDILFCILAFSSILYVVDINFFENLLQNNFGID